MAAQRMIKNKVLYGVLFVLFAQQLRADGWDPNLSLDEDFLFVSLGSHCEIAAHLNENCLRKAAFPFDWLVSSNNACLTRIINDDFLFFLDERYLFQHPTGPYIIENSCYEIEFRHDWPSNLEGNLNKYVEQLQEMKPKYDRRINRFRQLRNYPGKVFFIRVAYNFSHNGDSYWGKEESQGAINSEEAQSLKQALDQFFPCLDFALVIVNYVEANTPPIEVPEGVFEFKIRKSHKHGDYTALFHLLQHGHPF